ncbi:MAG: hypothetical protein IJ189_10570 [Clostridia bacterium]|nr:hypothetical protein [Clostridia bacterium]
METIPFPLLPALEDGIESLDRISRVPALPRNAYSRARAWLLSDAVSACVEQSRMILKIPPEEQRALSLLRRASVRSALSLSCLTRQMSEPEACLIHSFLAVEVTAALAARLPNHALRQALDFLLPEHLDQVYRWANAYDGLLDVQALLGGYIEIMPGRPMIACHRHPYDAIGTPTKENDALSRMAPFVLTAVSAGMYRQHTHAREEDPILQALHLECALIQEQHLTHFATLQPDLPSLHRLLLAEDTLTYLFLSCAEAEENQDVKQMYQQEALHTQAHSQKLKEMIARTDGSAPAPIDWPPPLMLAPSKGYVRDALKHVGVTARRDKLVPVGSLPPGADFFRYQKRVCPREDQVPSHALLERRIGQTGSDYRYEIAPHPIPALRSRSRDETRIGR